MTSGGLRVTPESVPGDGSRSSPARARRPSRLGVARRCSRAAWARARASWMRPCSGVATRAAPPGFVAFEPPFAATDGGRIRAFGVGRRDVPGPSRRIAARPARSPPAPPPARPRSRPRRSRPPRRSAVTGGSGETAGSRRTVSPARLGIGSSVRNRDRRGAATRGWTMMSGCRSRSWRLAAARMPRRRVPRTIARAGPPPRRRTAPRGFSRMTTTRRWRWTGSRRWGVVPRKGTRGRRRARPTPPRDPLGALYASTRPPP